MLTGQILNSQATLNNYLRIGSLEFVPGESSTLVVKIINTQLGIRYILPSTAVVSFTFNKANNESETVTGNFFTDDRSIISTTLSSAVTSEILGGNFTMSLDLLGDGTDIKKVFVQNGLTRNLIGGC